MATSEDQPNALTESSQVLKSLKTYANRYRFFGWPLLLAGTFFFVLLVAAVLKNPMVAKENAMIFLYVLVATWVEANGLVLFFLHRKLSKFQLDRLVDKETPKLISTLRRGLKFLVILEITFSAVCLIAYPESIPFVIGVVYLGPKAMLKDRRDLLTLQEQAQTVLVTTKP